MVLEDRYPFGMEIVTSTRDPVGGTAAANPQPPAGTGSSPFVSSSAATAAERTWTEELRLAVRDVSQLLSALDLTTQDLPELAHQPPDRFSLLVPWPFVRRMRPRDPKDPLLRQVLPVMDELSRPPGYALDPVGDLAARQAPGLLHKYHARALLVVSGACGVHCRYCFRRHFPYTEDAGPATWDAALWAIKKDTSIEELILSGGDPWVLSDRRLAELFAQLAAVGHLQRLRVHTRLPVVIPQRVTEGLLAGLCGTRLVPVVVVHVNHPQELDEATVAALRKLHAAGVPLLNQAVLLAGINDDAQVLAELSRRLIEAGVLPYYLHQLDRVAGAAHFEVSEARGRQLVARLRRLLPGYLVPRYVREVAGAPYKVVLG
jgi:EF-P beta-lysylation protein EpmB